MFLIPGKPAGFGPDDTGGGTVKLQYQFNEESGPIIDNVNNVELPVLTGSPNYRQLPNFFAFPLIFGIGFHSGNPNQACFGVDGNVSEADIDNESWVAEWFARRDFTSTTNEVVLDTDRLNTGGMQLFYYQNTNDKFQAYIKAEDGTLLHKTWTIPNVVGDGLIHHYRLAFNINGKAKFYVDNVASSEEWDATPFAGKKITSKNLAIGGTSSGARSLFGALFGFRFTTGTYTANAWE